MKTIITFGLICSILVACSVEDLKDDVKIPLTKWQGSEPHLIMRGNIDKEDIDISITGAAAVKAAGLVCEREYELPVSGTTKYYDDGKLVEVKLIAEVKVAGKTKELNFEFKKHDFSKDAAGSKIKIIPRVDDKKPAASEMWAELEWHQGDNELLEAAAQGGSYTQMEFTGKPGSDGLIIPDNQGTIGGFVDAVWSESESLRISFSAACGTNDISEEEIE